MVEAVLACPECSSEKLFRDGTRYIQNEATQRWRCRVCGYRFSESRSKFHTSFSSRISNIKSSQVCVLTKAKNLTETTESNIVGGLQKNNAATLDFAWRMKKTGLRESTIKNRTRGLNRLSQLGADLKNPDSVLTILATEPFTDSVKLELVRCYNAFCQSFDITWKKPKVHYERPEPRVPTETEINTLIAGCGKRTATLLQVMKDTGARVSEAVRMQRKDIDYTRKEITIAKPSKGSNSRIVRVSDKCLAMIKNIPCKYDDFIFSPNTGALRDSFNRSREKLAQKLNEDNLRKVHFHSLRHYKGAKEQREFHDSARTQYILGHKNPQNTALYQHYDHNSDSDEWIVKRPLNTKEEDELISTGFQFVRLDESEGHPIYRKRK